MGPRLRGPVTRGQDDRVTALLEALRRPRMQRELQDAMKRAWTQLDNLDAETERRILKRVVEMRGEVLDRLSALETRVDEDGNETWQATALRAFEAELRRVSAEFSARLAADLTNDLERAAGLADVGYRDALSALARGLDVPTPLITLSPLGLSSDLVQAATLYNAGAFRGLGERIVTDVNREIQRVVFGGQSRWDAVRNIRDMLAADPKWAGQKLPPKTLGKLTQAAVTIERTAVMSVFNIAADRAYREALEELPELRVEWMTVKDSRVDATCVALHGKRKDPRGTFPGGLIAPPAHPRCLVGGTIVSSPMVLATSERWYVGEVVEIRTAAGHVLTVTPNHPVLTPGGWVAAGLLNVGSDVVSSADPERLASAVSPDEHHGPSAIEDVVRAFSGSFPVATVAVPTSAEDFHGDGGGSEISVIRANGGLGDGFDTAISEPEGQQVLGWRRVQPEALASLRGSDTRLFAVGAPALGRMGSLHGSQTLISGAAGLLKAVGFGNGAPLDPQALQGAGDSRAADGVALAQALFGLASEIEAHQLVGVGRIPTPPVGAERGLLGAWSDPNSGLSKSALNRPPPDPLLPGDLSKRRAGLVSRDQVIKIIRHPGWQGHVYNLETSLGWYIASGIVTHNCRCRTVAWMPGWASLGVES